MDWQGRIVLVTGAGGFLGGHVARALVQAGARVRGLSRRPMPAAAWEWVDGSLEDAGSLRRAARGAEVVFHLAGLAGVPASLADPGRFLAVNAGGTVAVLEAARAEGVGRVVHVSSAEIYGRPQRLPVDESHPSSAGNPYAASKIAAEAMVEAFHRAFGLATVILRPFNLYGPGQSSQGVVASLAAQALAGGPLRLGNRHTSRDFTFAADAARAVALAGLAEAAVGHAINIGSGTETTIGQLAETVARLTGTTLAAEPEADKVRAGAVDTPRVVADCSRARALLGWRAETGIEDGLRQTIASLEKGS